MIKKIIACSDIHIRNFKRSEEYVSVLNRFIDDCNEIVNKYGKDEVRIVIAGDLFHGKLDISEEGYVLASWFLRKLGEICRTYIIAGNHDMNMENLERLDPITAMFNMCNFENVIYLDKELSYESGIYTDDNVNFFLYSSFSNFSKPEFALTGENSTNIALYHGVVKNAKNASGFIFENGLPISHFEGTDFGILGHIHKTQELLYDGNSYVYCGSLLQHEHGESVNGHGYILIDIDSLTYSTKNIANEEYGFYTFAINSIDDIDNDVEEVVNL